MSSTNHLSSEFASGFLAGLLFAACVIMVLFTVALW